ncbi:MAG TPA: hypothetical protein VJZ04_08155 [Lachnospiraceae bacterium]|nr:hypothetical protein [Lachnospiraceae bacterium]
MNVKKILFGLVGSFALSVCLSPVVTLAATISDSVSEIVLEANIADSVPEALTECPSNFASISVFAVNSANPVCDHRDPQNPLHPHSTMRYLRTVNFYNWIELRYDVRRWYQCVLCTYETFFVTEYIY